jgi:hypothetical protein
MDHAALQGHEALVADRDPMRIAPEIRHHLLRARKGGFRIDDPVLAPQGIEPQPKHGGLRQRRRPCRKGQPALGERVVETVEILPAKDPREGFDREEELPTSRRNPPVLLGGQGAAGHETMHMEMLVQVLPPGMEDHGGSEVPTQPARVTPKGVQRVPRALEEEGIEDTGIALGHRIEGVGEGKDTVEIRDGQQVSQARLDPSRLGQGLALGAVAIPTRMVAGLVGSAVVALQQVPAQSRGAALFDRAHHAELLPREGVGGPVRLPSGAENVRNLEGLASWSGSGVLAAHGTRAPSAWLLQEIQRGRGLQQVLLRDMEIAQGRPDAVMA